MRPILAAGWDVGGWHGKKQAIAVALYDGHTLSWPAEAELFSISDLHRIGGSAMDLIRIAWPDVPRDALDRFHLVIAIDAPLGFPQLFTHVLGKNATPEVHAESFYDNPLAFRRTDRWIHQIFGKRPLSASFDKLGNNAVTAMIHARRWSQEHGFRILPQQGQGSADHVILEVYPALVKRAYSVQSECRKQFVRLLPNNVMPGTDQYDAAICAVLAASYRRGDDDSGIELPPLIHPPPDVPRYILESEGWIYAVPSTWLDDQASWTAETTKM